MKIGYPKSKFYSRNQAKNGLKRDFTLKNLKFFFKSYSSYKTFRFHVEKSKVVYTKNWQKKNLAELALNHTDKNPKT